MSETDGKKCAHVPCACYSTDKFCSQSCKDAGSKEVEIGCDCGHPSCDTKVTA
jgi:hypothetical protein